jgi:Flp pilus assembly protein TadB
MRNARALAIVTGTTLVRLQVRRMFNQPFTRFATSYDDALAWVVSGIEPDGATKR